MNNENLNTRLLAGLFTILTLTNLASAKSNKPQLVILHEAVGDVIDAAENKRFHLVRKDIGLIAAKIYQSSNLKWKLHLLGIRDNTPWIYIQGLQKAEVEKFNLRIESVIKSESGGLSPDLLKPVFSRNFDFALQAEQPVEIKLLDGSKFYGHITACSPEKIEFETISGTRVQFNDAQISNLRRPRGTFKNGDFMRYDPNHVRLFLAPTGRTLRQGEINFSDIYIFFPSIGVGITDFIQVGGGVSIIPGAENQLFYISPKIRLAHLRNIDLSVGLVYMGVPGEGDATVAYSALSIGDPSGGLTLGITVPIDDESSDNVFGFIFGGEKQVSNSFKLITENWLFTGGDQSFLLISGGLRFIGEKLTVGLGFFTSKEFIDASGFPFVPWLDFSYTFGK